MVEWAINTIQLLWTDARTSYIAIRSSLDGQRIKTESDILNAEWCDVDIGLGAVSMYWFIEVTQWLKMRKNEWIDRMYMVYTNSPCSALYVLHWITNPKAKSAWNKSYFRHTTPERKPRTRNSKVSLSSPKDVPFRHIFFISTQV